MNDRARKPAFLLVLLLSFVGMLVAGPLAELAATERVVVELVAGELDPTMADYGRVVRDGIRVALERRGYQVLPDDQSADPDVFGNDAVLLQYEYVLLGFLPRLHVALTVRDLQAGTRITSAMTVARGNITLYTSLDAILDAIDPPLDRYLLRRADPVRSPWPVPLAGELLLPTGHNEGTLVILDRITGAPLPSDLHVAEGAELPLSVSREGYYGQEFLFPVTGPTPALPDPTLRRRRSFGAQLQYSYPRLVGASMGGRYYPLPDLLYVGMELGLHMSGLPGETPSRLTHLDPRLIVGYLPRGMQDRALQPWFSSGFGLVTTFTSYGDSTTGPYLDRYWNVLNLGVELGRGMVRLYSRIGITYYFEGDRSLWMSGVNPDSLLSEAAVGTVLRW